MLTLILDAAIAAVNLADRACTAVEQIVRRQVSPRPDAGAPPTTAGVTLPASATGGGGHPRDTSELLRHAEAELQVAYADSGVPAVVAVLMAELRDRAADLSACGD